MSWLEYLGLEYLLGDGKGNSEGLSFGGLVFLIGGACWLLMSIFQASLVNKGIVVFNLLISILLLLLTVIKYIKAFKFMGKDRLKLRIGFYIFSIIVVVVSFIYGLNNTYHSLIFDYEYIGIYSGIASILYPLVILNLLFPFFCEKNKLGSKIQEGMETIGLFIILTIISFCIGQIVTLGLSFGGNENFYDRFIVYNNNTEVTSKNENIEDDYITTYAILDKDYYKNI